MYEYLMISSTLRFALILYPVLTFYLFYRTWRVMLSMASSMSAF